MPVVLTIAGSDPAGGAGIQADLKTFSAFGAHGLSVVTAVTVQDTIGVGATGGLAATEVLNQLEMVTADFSIGGAKTGLLPSGEVVRAVAGFIRGRRFPPLVVDPVFEATGGHPFLDREGRQAVRDELLPLALLVTPNIREAEELSGLPIRTGADVRRAASAIRDLGPQAVLVKGGHLATGRVTDLYYDGKDFLWLSSPRVNPSAGKGTGCTLSAALAACLAHGIILEKAVTLARTYVSEALRRSRKFGAGQPILDHMWPLSRPAPAP